MKKKKEELQKQLYHKPRYQKHLQLTSRLSIENNTDAAEALLVLHAVHVQGFNAPR